jgi:hypothetical protein
MLLKKHNMFLLLVIVLVKYFNMIFFLLQDYKLSLELLSEQNESMVIDLFL